MTHSSIYVAIILSLAVTLCNASCDQLLGNGMSESDKQAALNAHNNYRALVQAGQVPGQPQAKNVYPLEWDDALANAAQDIADTCVFAHVPVDDDRFYVGQNLYEFWSTGDTAGADWDSAVTSWYDEYKDFVYPNVVWANTKLLGCGYTWFLDGEWYTKFYVCNYGPGLFLGNGMSESDKQAALDAHNNYRALVQAGEVPGQPKAKNVYPLEWDDALEKAAQDIADTCIFAHVTVDDDRFYWVGQNIFAWGSTGGNAGADWDMAVGGWYSEYKSFVYPNVSNGVTGHYTQVVWAETELLGCGYTWYKEGDWYKKFYVCNYGPGGNYVGEAPYEVDDLYL